MKASFQSVISASLLLSFYVVLFRTAKLVNEYLLANAEYSSVRISARRISAQSGLAHTLTQLHVLTSYTLISPLLRTVRLSARFLPLPRGVR